MKLNQSQKPQAIQEERFKKYPKLYHYHSPSYKVLLGQMYSSKKLNVELWPPSLFKSTRNNPPVHILILTHRGGNKVSYSQRQKGQPSQTLCWFAPSKFWCSSPPGGLHTERGNFASPRTAPPRKSSSRINTTPFVFHFSGNPHLRCTNRQNQQGHLE